MNPISGDESDFRGFSVAFGSPAKSLTFSGLVENPLVGTKFLVQTGLFQPRWFFFFPESNHVVFLFFVFCLPTVPFTA